MLRIFEGLPAGVLGVEAIGMVTHSDFRNVLIPRAEAMMANGPVSVLYVITSEFTGFEVGALLDDDVFGVRHGVHFAGSLS